MTSYEILDAIFECVPPLNKYSIKLYGDITGKTSSVGVELVTIQPNTPTRFKIRMRSPKNSVEALLEMVNDVQLIDNTIQEVTVGDIGYKVEVKMDQFNDEGIIDTQQQLITKRVTLSVYKKREA